jgi:hypothetical protein
MGASMLMLMQNLWFRRHAAKKIKATRRRLEREVCRCRGIELGDDEDAPEEVRLMSALQLMDEVRENIKRGSSTYDAEIH